MILLLFFSFAATFISSVYGHKMVSLTPDNYDEVTKGKTVFIKFFAPWCGHSKKLAPDWERLAKEWDGDKVGLIAEIDCTGTSKKLCDANGVSKFPTLKYGHPSALEFYDGSRAFDDLLVFSKNNLKPPCTPSNMESCDDEKKKLIEKYQHFSSEEIKIRLKEEQKKLKDAKKEFDLAADKLQQEYQMLLQTKDEKVAEIRLTDLRLLQSIQKAKAKGVTFTSSSDEL